MRSIAAIRPYLIACLIRLAALTTLVSASILGFANEAYAQGLAAPSSVIAQSTGSTSVYLEWTLVSGASGYTVSYGTTSAATGSTVTTSSSHYSFTGLSSSTTYYFMVEASNTGSTYSSPSVSATTGSTALSAPILGATPASTSVTLHWSAVSGATGYAINRGTVSNNTPLLATTPSSTQSYTDSGLTAGTTYYYTVAALSANGEGSKCAPVQVTVGSTSVPTTPQDVAVQLPTNTSPMYVGVEWVAVSGATGYNIYRSVDPGGSGNEQLAYTTTSAYYNDYAVSNGQVWYYKVTAYNASGESPQSTEVSITVGATPASAPSSTAVTAGTGSATVSWSSVSPGSSWITYEVWRDTANPPGVIIADNVPNSATGVATSTYSDTGLTNGTTYYYRIGTVSNGDRGGRGVVVTAIPIAQVSGLTATGGIGQIALSWSAAAGATSYNIYRGTATGGEGSTPIASGVTATTYADSGLSSGTTYFYTVQGVNSTGTGNMSSESSAITIPATPQDVLVQLPTNTNPMYVSVEWVAVPGATSYKIYRSVDPGGSGNEAYAYSTTATYYNDYAVSNGQVWYYRVTAYNASGESAQSNEVSITVGATPINAPSGVAVTASTGQATVTWNTITPGVSAITYEVWRDTATPPGVLIADNIPNSSSSTSTYTDTGLTNGTTYYYRIGAVQNGDRGGRSNTVSAIPIAQVVGLTATGGNSQVALAWTAAAGATSYTIYAGTSAGSESPTPLASGVTSTSYTNTGLAGGTAYFYTVQGVNSTGAGTLSSEASATTATGPPTNVTAFAGNQTVTLNWSAVAGAVDGYNVYRGTSSGGEASPSLNSPIPITGTTYQDSGLTNGQKYYYYVTATIAGSESGPSSEVSATPNANPPLITGGPAATPVLVSGTTTSLSVTATDNLGPSSLTYTWSVMGTPPAPVTFSPNATNAASTSTATFTAPGTYNIEITVTDTAGAGATSGVAVQVVSVASAIAISPNPATVQTSGSQMFVATETDQFGAPVSPQPQLFDWSAASGTISTNGFYIAPSATGTDTVTVVDDNNSGLSATGAVTIGSGLGPDFSLPAPTGVTASVVGNTVTVSWSAVTGATSYQIASSRSSSGGMIPFATTSSSPCVVHGVEDGTTYYAVMAEGSGGTTSAYSAEVGASVAASGLGAPGSLTVVKIRDGQVTLSWGAVSGATGYNVKLSHTYGGDYGSYGNVMTNVKIPKCTVYNVVDGPTGTAGFNNYFVVSAIDASGESAGSNQVSALPTTDSVGSIYSLPYNPTQSVTADVYGNDGSGEAALYNSGSTLAVYWTITGPNGLSASTANPGGWTVVGEFSRAGNPIAVTAPAGAPVGSYTLVYGNTQKTLTDPNNGESDRWYWGPVVLFTISPARPGAFPGPAYPWQGSVGGVNTANGNKMTSVAIVGWTARGGMPVQFGVTHNSQANSGVGTSGEVGSKWISSFDISITGSNMSGSNANAPVTLTVTWGNGRTYTLTQEGNVWLAPPGVNDRLNLNGDGTINIRTEDDYLYHFVPTTSGGSYFLISQISDFNGNTIQVNHGGPNGAVSSVVDLATTNSTYRTLTFAYDANSRLSTVTDPLSRVWTLTYDGSGNLHEIAWPLLSGDSTVYNEQFGYNSNHDITSVTDRRGHTSTYAYNSDDSIASEAPPAGYTTTYAYSANASLGTATTTTTDPNSHTLTHNYAGGCLSSTVDALGYSESYTYDGTDALLTTKDRNGNLWTYVRDNLGNATSFVDPLGYGTTTVNSKYSVVVSKTDELGNTSTYNYDENDNPLTSTDAMGNVTILNYDTYGEETSSVDPLGHITSYTYDTNGCRISTTDADGNTTGEAFDALGRKVSSYDGLNQTTTYAVDNWNRCTIVTAPDNSTITATTYDANDNVLTVTDPSGNAITNVYDPDNRLLSHTNGRGDVTTNYYDGSGQLGLLSYTKDGNGHTTTYAYSPRNENLATYYPDETSESLTYLPGGQKSTHTDAKSQKITYKYTGNDRLWQVLYSTSLATTSFSYDKANRRTQMIDSTGTTVWTYDKDNRVTEYAAPNGAVTYLYDADGRCTQRGVANTFLWNYAFYNSGLLRTVTPPYGGTTSYVYDAADHLITQSDGNGAVASYTYNDLDEVTAEATVTGGGSQIAGNAYTYYSNGTVKTKTDFDGSTTTYAYDGADQLVSEARTGPNAYSVSYTYDHNSNRLTKTADGSTDAYVYDAADKLLHTSTKSFAYDADGNRITMTTGGATTTYNWDCNSRLTSISGTSAANTYNGLGLRVIRTSTSGASSYYTCDGADPASPVLRDGPDIYTEGLSQTATATGATSFYILDRLGSNTRMMNAAESVTDSQVYDGFGTSVVRTGSTAMPFGFVAKADYETDQDTGLMLLGHRFYDPSIGRFLSRDPIHDGPNDYAYCQNNPITAVDPTGEAESRGNPFKSLMNSDMGGDDDDKDNAKESSQKSLTDEFESGVDNVGADGLIAAAGTEAGNADAGHGSYLKAGGFILVGTILLATTVFTDGAGAAAHGAEKAAIVTVQKTYSVYRGIKNGKTVYIGITCNIARRTAEHGMRFDSVVVIKGLQNLSKNAARAFEQACIEAKGLANLQNKINSIAENNPLYNALVPAAKQFLVQHSIKF